MKKNRLHQDLIEALVITVGILIAFTALAFTTVGKSTFLPNKKCDTMQSVHQGISLEQSAPSLEKVTQKIRVYDEKGNLLAELENTANIPQGAELVMSLDNIDYYVVVR